MGDVEKYLDHILKPYTDIIDVKGYKKETLIKLTEKAEEYRKQGYDREEIEDLLKRSLSKLHFILDQDIIVDLYLFKRQTILHFLMYSILCLFFLIPTFICPLGIGAISVMIFLILVLGISYVTVNDYHRKLNINVYYLKHRKVTLFSIWVIITFINTVVWVTEYAQKAIDFIHLMANLAVPMILVILPIAFLTINRVIYRCSIKK